LGGGLGVSYADPEKIADFETYFGIFHENLKISKEMTVHFEMGRPIIN